MAANRPPRNAINGRNPATNNAKADPDRVRFAVQSDLADCLLGYCVEEVDLVFLWADVDDVARFRSSLAV